MKYLLLGWSMLISLGIVLHAQEAVPLPDDTSGSTEEIVLDDTDSTLLEEEPPPKPWAFTLRSNYRNSQVRNGVELSGSQPTLDGGFKVAHDIGASFAVTGTRRLGNAGFYQQTTINLGYTYEANDWLELYTDLSFYRYPNDSLNPLAGTSSSLSLGAGMDAGWLYFDLYFDRYFGTDAASYYSLNLSKYIGIGEEENFSITPGAGISFTSFELQTFRLVTKKGNTISKTKKIRGLSSLSADIAFGYNLGKGFLLTADPTLLIAYQQDLNSKSRSAQVLLTFGLRYRIKW